MPVFDLTRLQHRHNELCSGSIAYNKLMRALFLTPNPFRPTVTASADAAEVVESLRRDGVVLLPDSEVLERYSLREIVGPKGSVWLFDAGCGFHRALHCTGTSRSILHIKPRFVRRMLKKVIC